MRTRKHILAIAFLVMCFTVMLTAASFAASPIQSGIYTDKAVIAWTAPDLGNNCTVTGYEVRFSTDNAGYVTIATPTASTTSYTITGLSPEHQYDAQIRYSYRYKTQYSDYTYTEQYLGYINDIMLLPAKIQGVKQDRWYYYIKQIDMSWTKYPSISGYEWQLLNSSNKLVKSGTCSGYYASYAYINSISNGNIYRFRVRGYTTYNGATSYGEWSNLTYCIGQTPKLKGSSKNKKLYISWGKVTGATSYTVMMSTKLTGRYKAVKTIKANKKRKVTISKFKGKKLKKGKTYYVYIRTNKKVGNTTYTSDSGDTGLYVIHGKCK